MEKISMDKKYVTRAGLAVKLLSVSVRNQDFPVAAIITNTEGDEFVDTFTKYGNCYDDDCMPDLIEVTPWDSLDIDDPVMVTDTGFKDWTKRYFAGVHEGKPTAWVDGATSWSAESTNARTVWDVCRPATEED